MFRNILLDFLNEKFLNKAVRVEHAHAGFERTFVVSKIEVDEFGIITFYDKKIPVSVHLDTTLTIQ